MTHLDEPTLLAELATREYLARHGVPLVPATLVLSADELDAAVDAHGPEVVLKAAAPWLLHKTDLDLVRVGVTASTAAVAFDALVRTATNHGPIDGVIVSPHLQGAEILIGVRRDPTLGPFIVVGSGGTLVEIFDDLAIAHAPIDADRAQALIRTLRGAQLLIGLRGTPALDIAALARLVSAVSHIADEDERLRELDLNPVIVGVQGVAVVDARAVLAEPPPAAVNRRQRDLQPLFHPAGIAILGASTDPAKLGARIVRYLVEHGFDGRIVPVHRTAAQIHGQAAVPSVMQAGRIDLACIVVPPESVGEALAECGRAGIRNAIVHTAGFAEAEAVAATGAAAQTRLADTALRAGINVCGPNSLGIISPDSRIFTSFAGALESSNILPGRIGFVSQSGALASSLLSRSVDDGVGFSRWISSGNEADLDLSDFVGYLAEDDATSVIALFIEQIRDGDAFRDSVRRALEAGKPVLAYKSGRSAAGRRVTQSHTGALAGDDRLYEAFLADIGVVRVASLRDLLDTARVMVTTPLPRGRRLAVITMSGGASSVIADTAADLGLDLPSPDARTADLLVDLLPAAATVDNPLDVTAAAMVEPGILTSVVRSLLDASFADMVLVQLTTNADPVASRMATELAGLHRGAGKPLIISRLGSPSLAPGAMEIYRSSSVPVLTWPDDATRVAWALAAAGEVMAGVSRPQVEVSS